MFRIEMLPAGHGDALLVEYGDAAAPRRVLVDGGPWYAYDEVRARLFEIFGGPRIDLELLVVTHVDIDHVDGVIKLLFDPAVDLRPKDVWFNGWKHLQPTATGILAGQQGEYLGALLESRGLPWNAAFGGGAVGLGDGGPRTLPLDGDLQLTVLSPYAEQLDALRPVWEEAVTDAGIVPGDRARALEQLERRARYRPPRVLGEGDDDSEANGSSIALLAEHAGRRLLLAGDAWPQVLTRSLAALPDGGRPIHAYKLSHHGSFGSQSRHLVQAAAAERYLVSTNGSYYDHPSEDTMQLILRHHPDGSQPRFAFNYASDETRPWLERTAAGGYDSELAAGRAVDV